MRREKKVNPEQILLRRGSNLDNFQSIITNSNSIQNTLTDEKIEDIKKEKKQREMNILLEEIKELKEEVKFFLLDILLFIIFFYRREF